MSDPGINAVIVFSLWQERSLRSFPDKMTRIAINRASCESFCIRLRTGNCSSTGNGGYSSDPRDAFSNPIPKPDVKPGLRAPGPELLNPVQVAGYKVKCMLAEPKGKRGRQESALSGDAGSPATSASRGVSMGQPQRHERSFSGSFQSGNFVLWDP